MGNEIKNGHKLVLWPLAYNGSTPPVLADFILGEKDASIKF